MAIRGFFHGIFLVLLSTGIESLDKGVERSSLNDQLGDLNGILGFNASELKHKETNEKNLHSDARNVRGICERCNNINSAMAGIDVSGILPVDPPLYNPAVRGIIFDVDSDSNWIDTYKEIRCTASFVESSYSDFSNYIESTTSSHSSGVNFQMGYEVDVGVDVDGISLGTTVPPMFSRGWGNSESASSVEQHYKQNSGGVSHAEATCNIYKVTIYPENPDVKLSDSFITRIQKIDEAKTSAEKDKAMKDLIDEFGTHFSKETRMGVGLKFESRFTAEETLDYSNEQREKCTTKNGAKIFGIQLEEDSTDCKGSLNDTTTGNVGAVNRFSSSSYGSFPHGKLSEWQDSVSAMFADGTLEPLPINQEYDLILNLFSTPAVAAIKNLNGNQIDIERVTETAINGYTKYCYLSMDGGVTLCEIVGCASSVRLGDKVFNRASTDEKNRIIFQEWTTSPSRNQLFFKDNHWFISKGPLDIENPEFKSAKCPISGITFFEPVIDFQQATSTWRDCSLKCTQRKLCNYWEYKNSSRICNMIREFNYMKPTSEKIYTGTRDCPGSQNLRNSVFGSCVENHPNMWVSKGEQNFQKQLKMEANDPTSIVVTGGYDKKGNELASVEVIGNNVCSWPVPDFTIPTGGHKMAITPDGAVIACGGWQDPDHCISYDMDLKQWTWHSTLIIGRENGFTAITVPTGVYLLGGPMGPYSSEFLPKGSSYWVEGPSIPKASAFSCAVALSETKFAITLGDKPSNTIVYDMDKDNWTTWPGLKHPRRNHGCAKLGDKIIVAGGLGGNNADKPLSSTEIIDTQTGMVRTGGSMKTARNWFMMATLGGQYQILVAIGGDQDGKWNTLSSIEEWNDEKETWALSPIKLDTPRTGFSLVAVPHTRICKT